MTTWQKIYLLVICCMLLAISTFARAETKGYWHQTVTVTDMEETYNVVVGTIEVPVLDEEGEPTGKTITRPVTEKETRRWKEETRKPGPGGKGSGNFELNDKTRPYFIGHSPHDLMTAGEYEWAGDAVCIHYNDPNTDEEGNHPRLWVTYNTWKEDRPQASGTDISCVACWDGSGVSKQFTGDDCVELLKQ